MPVRTRPESTQFNLPVYDEIGRLRSVTGSAFDETFDFDEIGNLTTRSGQTLDYTTTPGPHQVGQVGPDVVTYDGNGNRKVRGTQGYTYNALDQLVRIDVGAENATFGYGHGGGRIWKRTNGAGLIRHFSKFAEGAHGVLTKHYWAGDVLIASHHSAAPEFSSLGSRFVFPIEAVVGFWGLVVLLLLGAGLQLRTTPLRIRQGALAARAVGAALLILATGPPMLLFPEPAAASGVPYEGWRHYHTDHLGSTQTVSGDLGTYQEFIRYDAYGKVRTRRNQQNVDVEGKDHVRREFTGHEAEHLSGLVYAGARFFDPELGQFLTHDAAGQFASPYAYGPGDPMNGTDPTGLLFYELMMTLLIVSIGLSAVSAIRAYEAGGWSAFGKAIGISIAGLIVGQGIGAAGFQIG